MKVRALNLGYINHQRRYPGDVFTLTPYKDKDGKTVGTEQQFSSRWMEKVDKTVPEVNQPKIPVSASTLMEHEEQRRVEHQDLPINMPKQPEIIPEKPAVEAGEQLEPTVDVVPTKAPSTGDADVI